MYLKIDPQIHWEIRIFFGQKIVFQQPVKGAPWQFAGAVLVLAALVWAFLSFHYSSVIKGKDATIQAKDAVIQAKEETVIESQKALESIKQTLTAKDELIILLTNQYSRMLVFQSELATAQTNIEIQEKKLADVEYWVENLYGKTTNETFSFYDTNKVMILPLTNGAFNAIFRLTG